jgi:Domain of unknown function (DUF4202)
VQQADDEALGMEKRMPDTDKFEKVIAAIDAANARDPNCTEIDGRSEPAELVYGRRMTATLARLAPDASEHLRIAARGQHIERWTSARKSYPEGRAGYLSWRNALKEFHARRLGEIMLSAGYGSDDIARVRSLVRKERLKFDREAQLLEDIACLVFLEHYLSEFSRKTNQEKLAGILAKTWKKMSPLGHEHALKLPLAPTLTALMQQVTAA